jgi:hexokinase
MVFLRTLATHIARRSASVVAASLFGLWELKAETEEEFLATLPEEPSSPSSSAFREETLAEMAIGEGVTTVAFNGSVVERYPGYRAGLQGFVDGLVAGSEVKGARMVLVEAKESSLRGAAVALACLV